MSKSPDRNWQFPIANVAHSANVTRWHSVRCLRYPSVAEHSFLVTMYTEYLASLIEPDMPAEQQLLLVRKSLWHDMAESITGDISTPLKRYLEAHFKGQESPLEKLERKLCKPYADLAVKTEDTHLAIISKLADVAEAIHFINCEGVGKAAQRIYRERTQAYSRYIRKGISEYPQYNWLAAQEFLDSLMNDEPMQIDFQEILEEIEPESASEV
jgi:5'-deoxynucleotidase